MSQIERPLSFVITAATSLQPRDPRTETGTLLAEYWRAHFLSWRPGRLENDPRWILKAIHYVHLQRDGQEPKSVRQTRASHSNQKHTESVVKDKMHVGGEKLRGFIVIVAQLKEKRKKELQLLCIVLLWMSRMKGGWGGGVTVTLEPKARVEC